MSLQRHIARLVTTAPPGPGGFAGAGHMAVEVVSPQDFTRSDPFIVLMDDRLDLPEGGLVSGPHPHAGFETVTLLLEGSNMATTSFTPVGNCPDSPKPILRPSPATGHDAEMLEV